MTSEVVIYDLDSNEISTVVKELKDKGYRVGVDFDFAYSTGKFDWTTHETIPRQTTFTIYNSKLATWFILKWS